MYKSAIIKNMPKIGEKRMEVSAACCGADVDNAPQPCTVVQVHPEHLWYRVQFDETGHFECFKVPELPTVLPPLRKSKHGKKGEGYRWSEDAKKHAKLLRKH